MHKACSSQLLPLPTDIEETYGTLSAVQVQTSLKEQSQPKVIFTLQQAMKAQRGSRVTAVLFL
jgi:hypothetical protein